MAFPLTQVSVTSAPVAIKAPMDCMGVHVQQHQGSDPPSTVYQVLAIDGATVLSTRQPGENYSFLPPGGPGLAAFVNGQTVGFLKVASGTWSFDVGVDPPVMNQFITDNNALTQGGSQDAIAQTISVTGGTAAAILAKAGTVILSGAVAATALTIADPIAGVDDGKELTIMSLNAVAHVITDSTNGFNAKGASGTLTFGVATKGNTAYLKAFNGFWYCQLNTGVTVA